jgi:predicted ATPase
MSNSREMRRLAAKWQQGTGWPQFLESLEITGIRGWDGQKVPFQFPIVALVGENGTGKSTILQCAAASYRPTNNAPPEWPTPAGGHRVSGALTRVRPRP